MKYTTIFSLLILSTICSTAQEQIPSKTRDLGITISRFSFEQIPFDLVYKSGRDNKFWRLEASSIGGSLNFPETRLDTFQHKDKSNNIGLSLRLAREKRIPITDVFTFYHGLEFGLSGSYREHNYTTNYGLYNLNNARRAKNLDYSIVPSIGYSLGAMFSLKPNLYLNFELSPALYYRLHYQKSERIEIMTGEKENYSEVFDHTAGFKFTQGAVSLGLFYTFTK